MLVIPRLAANPCHRPAWSAVQRVGDGTGLHARGGRRVGAPVSGGEGFSSFIFDLLAGQEVEMNDENLFPFQNLDAYRVARELARRVHAAKIRDRELRDQATRAAKSCFLCLCDGLPNEGAALRHKYFVEARNSLAETVGALDLAAAIGVVREEDATAVQALGARLRRMLTALLR